MDISSRIELPDLKGDSLAGRKWGLSIYLLISTKVESSVLFSVILTYSEKLYENRS